MLFTDYYQRLSKDIHDHNRNVGWWDGTNKWTVLTKLMLTVSEVSEAMEGDRKNLMDDKLPERKMLEVELADAAIRALDLAGHLDMKVSPVLHEMIGRNLDLINENQPPVPVLLFQICNDVVDWGRGHADVNQCLATIHAIADHLELDLKGAITDKREFNAKRADHKRENRAKENGKTY